MICADCEAGTYPYYGTAPDLLDSLNSDYYALAFIPDDNNAGLGTYYCPNDICENCGIIEKFSCPFCGQMMYWNYKTHSIQCSVICKTDCFNPFSDCKRCFGSGTYYSLESKKFEPCPRGCFMERETI